MLSFWFSCLVRRGSPPIPMVGWLGKFKPSLKTRVWGRWKAFFCKEHGRWKEHLVRKYCTTQVKQDWVKYSWKRVLVCTTWTQFPNLLLCPENWNLVKMVTRCSSCSKTFCPFWSRIGGNLSAWRRGCNLSNEKVTSHTSKDQLERECHHYRGNKGSPQEKLNAFLNFFSAPK